MAEAVSMPKQGQSVESCIITQWYKNVGDQISEGDLLFAYETDKAAFEEEAKCDGTLLEIFFEEGDEVPVLTNMAVIGNPGEDTSSFKITDQESAPESTPQLTGTKTVSEPAPTPTESQAESTLIRISPRARKMAEINNIAISGISGSGPNSRIIASDIDQLIGTKSVETSIKAIPVAMPLITSSTDDADIEKISNIRKIIATRMSESLSNSAQLTHHLTADARKILKLRKEVKARMESEKIENISLNDMICFSVIKTLKQVPDMNAHFIDDSIKKFYKVHLGMAVSTERGLMVPILRDASDYKLEALATQLKKLANDCRTSKIDPQLLQSELGSFTVSNLGAYGIEMFTPVLNLPQAGILGINTITYQARELDDGVIGFVPVIGLSLTYDHRAIDGAPASLFLQELKKNIESFNEKL